MSDTSDTWRQLQAHKRKQDDLRARLAKRRKERQGLIEEVVPGVTNPIETRESGISSVNFHRFSGGQMLFENFQM